MNLAINYSAPAAQLVQAGRIQPDFFKTPDWEGMIDEAKMLLPVSVHFTLEAGNGGLDEMDWKKVEKLAHTTGTPYINLHLDSRQKHFPSIAVDTTGESDIKQVYKVLVSDVGSVVERFGAEKVIVENSPYRGEVGKTIRPCVEPDLITGIVEETGCGLLLDISHAIITATYLGIDPKEYFSRLPVHKVKELHFAGIHNIEGQWMDHLSILEKDWKWLDWVLSQIQIGEWNQPWMLAFEYGGVGSAFEGRCDSKVIARQIPLL